MPWFLFGPTFIWLVVFLGWSYLCFWAGWTARGDDDLARFLSRFVPPPRRDDDDPPKMAGV
jgi:hypothetical protein